MAGILALIGGAIVLYSAYAYFGPGIPVLGFHAMYPALVGIALLTFGLIVRAE